MEPERGNPLSPELPGLRSLRTSDCRIIDRAKGGELVVLIVTVGHRRKVDKRLGQLIDLAGRKK